MKRRFALLIAFLFGLGVASACAQTPDLVKDALASFPVGTIHLEYSSPQALRRLPDYDSLRQRYVGPRLRDLEKTLAELGIEENDIDELALGWLPASSGMDLFGLAAGRFDLKKIAQSAQTRGIAPVEINDMPAYCAGAGLSTVCALILSDSRGAFGTLGQLSDIMDVRTGAKPSLGSDQHFVKILGDANRAAPIWGVAEGPAVTDWFKGWMPQSNINLDWAQVFENVTAVAYNIEAGDNVNLGLKLECNSSDAAVSLRQVFEGLKLAQQLAWQQQNPGQQNPFQGMEVSLTGSQVRIQLAATYAELQSWGGPGATPR